MKASNTTNTLQTNHSHKLLDEVYKEEIFDFMLSEESQYTDIEKIENLITDSINTNSYNHNVLNQNINDKEEYIANLDLIINKEILDNIASDKKKSLNYFQKEEANLIKLM